MHNEFKKMLEQYKKEYPNLTGGHAWDVIESVKELFNDDNILDDNSDYDRYNKRSGKYRNDRNTNRGYSSIQSKHSKKMYTEEEFEKHEMKKKFWKVVKCIHEKLQGCHFNETFAKLQVKKMFHEKDNGEYREGEKFNIYDVEQIANRHRKHIGNENTIWDVYVALNAQYHDYDNLFKDWFHNHDERMEKIIESAICFWFDDDDCPEGKVWEYFKK